MWRGGMILLAVMAVTGCKRHPAPPPAPPATQTVIVAPATQAKPAVPSVFVISGQPFNFPPCRAVTRAVDGGLRVTLYSDDPPDALRDGYLGNSFYFRFTLDETTDLVGQQYVISRSASDPEETSDGLFIAGGRQTLRPLDVKITFDRIDEQTVVTVNGRFALHEDQPDNAVAPVVNATAELDATVSDAKK